MAKKRTARPPDPAAVSLTDSISRLANKIDNFSSTSFQIGGLDSLEGHFKDIATGIGELRNIAKTQASEARERDRKESAKPTPSHRQPPAQPSPTSPSPSHHHRHRHHHTPGGGGGGVPVDPNTPLLHRIHAQLADITQNTGTFQQIKGWLAENARDITAGFATTYSLASAFQSSRGLAATRDIYGADRNAVSQGALSKIWGAFNPNYNHRDANGNMVADRSSIRGSIWSHTLGAQTHRGQMAGIGLKYGFETKEVEQASYGLNKSFNGLGANLKQVTDDVAMFSRVFDQNIDATLEIYEKFHHTFGMGQQEIFDTLTRGSVLYQKYVHDSVKGNKELAITAKQYNDGLMQIYEYALEENRPLKQVEAIYTNIAKQFQAMGISGERAAKAAVSIAKNLLDTSRIESGLKQDMIATAIHNAPADNFAGKSSDEIFESLKKKAMEDKENLDEHGELKSQVAEGLQKYSDIRALAGNNRSSMALYSDQLAEIFENPALRKSILGNEGSLKAAELDKVFGRNLKSGDLTGVAKAVQEQFGMDEQTSTHLTALAKQKGSFKDAFEELEHADVSDKDLKDQAKANETHAKTQGALRADISTYVEDIKDKIAGFPVLVGMVGAILALMKGKSLLNAGRALAKGNWKQAARAALGLGEEAGAAGAGAAGAAEGAAGGAASAAGTAGKGLLRVGGKLLGGVAGIGLGALTGYDTYQDALADGKGSGEAKGEGIGAGVGQAAGGWGGAAAGAAAGAALGSVVPIIGTGIGAVAGGIIGGVGGGLGGEYLGKWAGGSIGSTFDAAPDPLATKTSPADKAKLDSAMAAAGLGIMPTGPVASAMSPTGLTPGGMSMEADGSVNSQGDYVGILKLKGIAPAIGDFNAQQSANNPMPAVGNGAGRRS